MEEKGIVLRELGCRTAAELPPPELPDCRRATPTGAPPTGAPPTGAPPTGAPGVPPLDLQQESGGGSSSAVRQLSSRSTIPFSSMSPPPDCFGDSPAAPAGGARRQSTSSGGEGIVLPELSCRAAAELPPPELLVHWSTKSKLCSDWRGVGKWELILKCVSALNGGL
ncbi:unnamed protein product [Boreogadus saida]